ncbi:MAG: hypothetical protein PHY30_02420 [Candidatus Pacebacteria bacterium]|nr:hypothetical protein [Candidatus Paceibacterota bacterium]
MNKQKTLIFSLSGVLFLAVSFIVYSWSEPTTTMPSGYTAPLNISDQGQTKNGWLKLNGALTAPMVYDKDDSSYYIDPSGSQSKLAGNLIAEGNITSARPTKNEHVVTKGYVDGLIEGIVPEITSFSNVTYILGDASVGCPSNSIEIMRNLPFGILCGVMEEPLLLNNFHSEMQCEILKGDVTTVEDSVKLCKFYNVQVCPNGWTQYKNWSKTRSDTISETRTDNITREVTTCGCTTGQHTTWSNTPIELCGNGIDRYGPNSFNPYWRCDASLSKYCSASYTSSYSSSYHDVWVCGRAIVEELGCY